MPNRPFGRFALPSLVALLVPALTSAGCRSHARLAARVDPPGPPSGVSVERVDYRGWPGCFRLTNGTVDVVIVPQIGRVMRYGPVGGPNLLWENPALAGRAPNPSPAAGVTWANFGGDKVWPWPQDWAGRTGRAWPPPPEADQAGYDVIMDGGTVRMTSAPLRGFDVRVVRELTLAPTGTQLTIDSRLEPARAPAADRYAAYTIATTNPSGQPATRPSTGPASQPAVASASQPTTRPATSPAGPLAAWTVTQFPPPDQAFARLVPGAGLREPYWGLTDVRWDRARPAGEGVFAVTPQPKMGKVGFDADVLAWRRGTDLVVLRCSYPGATGGPKSGERGQLWNNVDPPYVELEFTGPMAVPFADPPATLRVVWTWRQVSADATPEAVADPLRQ